MVGFESPGIELPRQRSALSECSSFICIQTGIRIVGGMLCIIAVTSVWVRLPQETMLRTNHVYFSLYCSFLCTSGKVKLQTTHSVSAESNTGSGQNLL